jgi:hypothetical protein
MTPDRAARPDRSSEFDPGRSSEIRSLLTSVVAGSPRPRPARLSRAAFALTATAALLFAGGIGAGTVLAFEQVFANADVQDAATPDSPASAAEAFGASAGDISVDDLRPIFIMNGEVGYAYRGALEPAEAFADDSNPTSETPGEEEAAGLIPIYLADGVTVVGYYDPASLIHK